MIFYNGASGSLGQYFAAAAADGGEPARALAARLEDRAGLARELFQQRASLLPGRPVFLVQLAARVSVPACERDPRAAEQTNVIDTAAYVAEFVSLTRGCGAVPSVLYVSSGHVYAAQPEGVYLDESAPLAPRSVYARTKLDAERALEHQSNALGYPLLIARVFGLFAPSQPDHYLLPGLIRRARTRDLAAIPGLSFVRDLLDARDVCRHLVRACSLGFAPDRVARLNVCSGEPLRLRDLMVRILELSQPSAAELIASLGEAPGRADDVPWIVGDPRALEARLQTRARSIAIDQTVRDALGVQTAPDALGG